jgi:transposase-like protein
MEAIREVPQAGQDYICAKCKPTYVVEQGASVGAYSALSHHHRSAQRLLTARHCNQSGRHIPRSFNPSLQVSWQQLCLSKNMTYKIKIWI